MRRLLALLSFAALPAFAASAVQVGGVALIHTPPRIAPGAPVLLLFDPGGDAEGAIRRAAPSCDASGVILVASIAFRDYLKDPDYRRLLADLKAMIQARYPGSPVWAGGFSGGARIAVGWAQQERGWIRGVVCFGGFYDRGGLPPEGTLVFLACGNEDPVRSEMEQARAALQGRGYLTTWRLFLGGHQWPPSAVIRDAVGFIQPAPAR
jgi:dienelactone hydrolase